MKVCGAKPKGTEESQEVLLSIEVERQFLLDIEMRKNVFLTIKPSFNTRESMSRVFL